MKAKLIFCLAGMIICNNYAFPQTEVSGYITENTTWASGSHYVLTGSLTIRNNATLTIETGVQIDFGSRILNVGSGTAGFLAAEGAIFTTGYSSERNIIVQDGGSVNTNNCQFDHISFDIKNDAGTTSRITGCSFNRVQFPLKADINRIPFLENNTGSVTLIATGGTVGSDLTVQKSNWDYALMSPLYVRYGARLVIAQGVSIDLVSYDLHSGTSNSQGTIVANGVSFLCSGSYNRAVKFTYGGTGTISNCSFNNVYIDVQANAGDEIILNENFFSNVTWPIIMSAMHPVTMSDNHAENEIIGLKYTITDDCSLPLMEWPYAMAESFSVKDNATLTIESGVQIDFISRTLSLGSGTAGFLAAGGVIFKTDNSSERNIVVQDGGSINANNCQFDHISIDIRNDAETTSSITGCSFNRVQFPVKADINCIPYLDNNTSSTPVIATGGTVSSNLTLAKLPWDYVLASTLFIRDDAELNIASGVIIDLRSYVINVGTNSQPGKIISDRVSFLSSSTSDKAIKFMDGGTGVFSNCLFDNVYIDVQADAGEGITLTGNSFANINWPVLMSAMHPVVMSNNQSDKEFIGLKYSITATSTLPLLEWPYALTESVTIRDNATLTIAEGVSLLLNGKYLYTGAGSTNTGILEASEVFFYDEPKKLGRIHFRANSSGNLSGCNFENCRVHIDGASPVIENSRFLHSREAIYIDGAANPVIRNNDFYNNTKALDNRGDLPVDASQNWWAHASGPIHDSNAGGMGETISGDVNFVPLLTSPHNGAATGILDPSSVLFTDVVTGVRHNSSFIIRNDGDEDLLITHFETNSSGTSVSAADRIWVLPDSSLTVPFSFTALEPGLIRDTIFIHTNDPENALHEFTIQGEGHIESLILNFFYIDVDSFPLVKCHFSLSDQAWLPVRALTQEQLELSEQNEEISDFVLSTRSSNSPVKVALVTDRSGSMAGSPLRDAKTAAIDFINNLSPFDEACVISFNESVRLDQAFTNDKTLLGEAVNNLRSSGSTAVFDAIDLAIEELKNLAGIRAVLALTDGKDNSSSHTASEVINKARLYGINIYTIGLGNEAEPTLTSIAYQTGGLYYYSPTSKELSLIYRMISGQIQNLYMITYTADEEGPFPRKVEIGVEFDNVSDSDVRFYSIGDSEIDLAGAVTPFKLDDFAVQSKNYFYYYVDDAEKIIPEGFTASWFMDSYDQTFPCGFHYLGEGLMQVWMNMNNVIKVRKYTFSFPDSLDQSGGWLKLKNKPPDFEINAVPRMINQDIDVFAGGSLGGSVILGGAGAGPSVAAAKISATGHAGMGMNFERDAAGNEWINRRLEAGQSVEAKVPAVNTVVDIVEAGVKAGIDLTGTLGQTLYFPANHPNPSLINKAKTAYILETLSIGGMALSPWFGVVLTAVIESLKLINPDVNEIYDDLFESWNVGASIEGSVGAEISISAGEGSGLPDLTLAEAAFSITVGGMFTHYVQTNGLSFALALATAFDVGLLSFEVSGIDLKSVFGGSFGSEISVGANFNTSEGFTSLDLGYLTFESANLSIWEGFYGKTVDICVPKAIIVDGINRSGTLMHDINKIFTPGSGIPNLSVGVNRFTSAIGDFFLNAEDTLLNPDDIVTIELGEQWSVGASVDVKASLDLALGVGAGIEFGVNVAYMDKVAGPEGSYFITRNMLLPLYEAGGVSQGDRMFNLYDELKDLIDGVIDLVADGIANIVEVGEYIIDLGVDLAIDFGNGALNLGGQALGAGSAIIRSADPRNWRGDEEPFLGSRVQYCYHSDRVLKEGRSTGFKSGAGEESDLYLVSHVFDVSIFNEAGELVEEYDPLRLKLALNHEMFSDLGFAEEDKSLVRIYMYVPENMSWIRYENDFSSHPDSVSADISYSATYAAGIEIFPDYDTEGPKIIDYIPKEGYGIAGETPLWARLYEGPMEVGIDLSATRIILDGAEVYATWDPVNKVISHRPKEAMEEGEHQMRIETADYRGNNTELTVNFTVNSSGINNGATAEGFNPRVFPNPFSEEVNIEFSPVSAGMADVAVYDLAGRRIAEIFRGIPEIGVNVVSWNRRLSDGSTAAPGLYFIRISQADKAEVMKVTVR